jgi:cytochrome c553
MMKCQSMIGSLLVCTLAWLLPAGSVHAEGSAQEGETKAATCTACHGPAGNSINPLWPNLAGQHPLYILRQLEAFKTGIRTDPLMSPMAAPLSEDDMQDLAAYFAAQTPTGLEADPEKAREGERLYRGGDQKSGIAACAACHGPSGRGNPAASFPSIGGQHAPYVAAQLKAYRGSARKTDQAQNQMMRDVANALSDSQIEAVASYIQGLR